MLFDLDFRKNRDPELRARLGPPIVEIPNLHPDLKFKIQLGASNGEKTTGCRQKNVRNSTTTSQKHAYCGTFMEP